MSPFLYTLLTTLVKFACVLVVLYWLYLYLLVAPCFYVFVNNILSLLDADLLGLTIPKLLNLVGRVSNLHSEGVISH